MSDLPLSTCNYALAIVSGTRVYLKQPIGHEIVESLHALSDDATTP